MIHEDVAWGLRCSPARSVDGAPVDELSATMARPLLPPPSIAARAVAAARRPSSGPVARLDDMFFLFLGGFEKGARERDGGGEDEKE